MSKDYKLEIIDDEKWKLPRIRVIFSSDEYYINTYADISEGYDLEKMAAWCLDNDCGYRSSYNEFKFRNKEQMTMFILRWS